MGKVVCVILRTRCIQLAFLDPRSRKHIYDRPRNLESDAHMGVQNEQITEVGKRCCKAQLPRLRHPVSTGHQVDRSISTMPPSVSSKRQHSRAGPESQAVLASVEKSGPSTTLELRTDDIGLGRVAFRPRRDRFYDDGFMRRATAAVPKEEEGRGARTMAGDGQEDLLFGSSPLASEPVPSSQVCRWLQEKSRAAGANLSACQPASVCHRVPQVVVHQKGMMIRGPNRGNTADGPEQQGRERERDGDDERLGRLEHECIGTGKTSRLETGTAG
ncbi:hypothetical protein LA080_000017 [Diaporthe eres]|nr:hypothetical protein LA080_000017 [Diaporthe eres]